MGPAAVELQIVRLQAGFFQQKLGRPDFVRIDGEQLRPLALDGLKLLAQLRELTMAHRSGIAIDEHEHHGLFASVVAQSDRLAGGRFQFEVGCRLTNRRRVDCLSIP